MNITKQTAIKESKVKITSSTLIRWAGLSAMVAGILFIAMQAIHPHDVLSAVTTDRWAIVHMLGVVMSLFGLYGVTGLYARQVEEAGWLGLVGYLLFSLFFAFSVAFQFAEAFFSPVLATHSPEFVEGLLGMVTGAPSPIDLGALPVVYGLTGFLGYVLGGLLFGIATLRAGILPRRAGGLLAIAAASVLASSLFPHPLDRIFAVPMGLALTWLGYALWSEQRVKVSEALPGRESLQLDQIVADYGR
jgi:MFS family permease